MIDEIDRRILKSLQRDADRPLAEIAADAGLSTSPCWRRIQRLKKDGILGPQACRLNRRALNLDLVVFVTIRTAAHNSRWLADFEAAVRSIPEIVEIHRLAGHIDYLLKVVVPGIAEFDAVYKRLTNRVEISEVSSLISMETLRDTTELPLDYC